MVDKNYVIEIKALKIMYVWVTISAKKTDVCLHFQLGLGVIMSCLDCLCLFTYGGVQHILCCVFVLFFFVLCTLLPISLDCPCLIAPSGFSNIY